GLQPEPQHTLAHSRGDRIPVHQAKAKQKGGLRRLVTSYAARHGAPRSRGDRRHPGRPSAFAERRAWSSSARTVSSAATETKGVSVSATSRAASASVIHAGRSVFVPSTSVTTYARSPAAQWAPQTATN